MARLSFFAVILMVGLSSCSPKLSPFTQRMYDDFGWSDDDLKRIQFYLSEEIVLVRDKGADDSRIDDGKIRVEDTRKVEKIVFKKGTPGVLLETPRNNRFAISFDETDNYLIFGPSKKNGGRYTLRAKDWDKRSGVISYNGTTYRTSSSSAYSALMVDIKKARKTDFRSKNVKGRRIDS